MRRPIVLLRSACLSLCLSPPVWAAPPPALLEQVQRLSELLRDGYASWYREATETQTLQPDAGQTLLLVLFTVEGFGGGNRHTQYLAAFEAGEGAGGKPYYTLLDVIAIGGKGWRAIEKLQARATRGRTPIEKLQARATRGRTPGEIVLSLPAKVVGPDDAPNFPGRPASVRLSLRDGRFSKQAGAR
ncbi:hypothetical protein [Plasticicumulans sp.]|uniref:hypothetical protein n=1 Tax=Plasticicumulans sp. TaxID=2307179 RepID=UPI002BE33CC6|nr:hypothetical protein [Plasticicumulans sp.]HNM42516.1 hypothetical protein [Plasticicumulans sp.]